MLSGFITNRAQRGASQHTCNYPDRPPFMLAIGPQRRRNHRKTRVFSGRLPLTRKSIPDAPACFPRLQPAAVKCCSANAQGADSSDVASVSFQRLRNAIKERVETISII